MKQHYNMRALGAIILILVTFLMFKGVLSGNGTVGLVSGTVFLFLSESTLKRHPFKSSVMIAISVTLFHSFLAMESGQTAFIAFFQNPFNAVLIWILVPMCYTVLHEKDVADK